jgi:hypothetical protein
MRHDDATKSHAVRNRAIAQGENDLSKSDSKIGWLRFEAPQRIMADYGF